MADPDVQDGLYYWVGAQSDREQRPALMIDHQAV